MKSYFKFLSRNKLYSTIEALGLVVSIAFVILTGNYIWRQFAIAYANPLGNSIYAVGANNYMTLSWWDKTVFEDKLPEAKAVCRISNVDTDGFITIDDNPVSAIISEADPELFDIFPSLSLLEGNLDEFRLEGHCLVSEQFARRFPNGDIIGKPLKISYYDDEYNCMVCGIFKDSQKSMLPYFDVILNPEYDIFYASEKQKPFTTIGQYTTLINVYEYTDREQLAEKISDICKSNYSNNFGESFPIYTLPEVFFADNQWVFKKGKKTLLQIMTVMVLLLLVSAILNYINLNMALSGKRAKEMATRRLHGASQGRIIMKYITESVSFTTVCFVFALLLAVALIPAMNNLLRSVSTLDTSQYVAIQLNWSVGVVTVYLASILLLGVLAGIVPAAVASRFAPIDIVRGTYRRKSKMLFSKVSIVFQNTMTIVLLAFALLMEVQMRHMMERPINSRSEGLYSLQLWVNRYSDVEPLIDRLNKIPTVKTVGYGNGFAGQFRMETIVKTPEGETVKFKLILCDEIYFNMLELHIVDDFGAPRTNSVWMSKSLADKLAINDSLVYNYTKHFFINGSKPEAIGGVYADIPTASASAAESGSYSAVVIANANDLRWGNGLMIDVSGNYKETEKAIMEAYNKYSMTKNGMLVEAPQSGYVNELLGASLLPEKMSMRLIELFMLISLLISLLGLIAMSTHFSAESTKSIAVRKVFGSNVKRELWRTVSDYMILVGIAAVIGTPIASWSCGMYLNRFAYRIAHYGWIVAVTVVIALLMAFLSVLWQTLRAAKTNPSEALKKE